MPFLANPTYEPAMSQVTNITNGFPAIVTTATNHNLISGTIVRLVIPEGFGMVNANHLTGIIITTGATTFTIDIDTTFFDPFVIPGIFPFSQQISSVVPIGEINSILTAATDNILN